MSVLLTIITPGATDGHAKNRSIYIEQQDQYRLTPLYDILSAFPAFISVPIFEEMRRYSKRILT
ncbi:hypothetical protein WG68_12535 [Arsukibacterium ikkense]|uniref:HipA-like C-terminal domain-containing protein n=1 Tax=Arsukibacterium ikkense TaxID=336831 RepID=A0A0M2V5N0_9GAMM|nr:HipA domain-containing protein [Arsukibacterium ikkense]KKO44965.1 hypothetical protein WG68_12535 [Arsukibacterium ikkense]